MVSHLGIYVVRKIRGSITEEEPLEKPPCSAVGKSGDHGNSEHAPAATMSLSSDDVSGTAELETSRKTTVEKCGT
ncbi:hypothetical protein D4764_01G0009020 [Takifugu flavidus]|uniref:Uncharacterized protein n=1 Tax=Takifugu flavidus TaxID=433684 RepID=A0A5C6PRT3_9TELE|nr:hypothetical protein D4764_01G0009020 [Takifugu flavidus]